MGCHSGTRVKNATELKKAAPQAGNRTVMIHPNGKQNPSERMLVFCDIETDPNIGWHLIFMTFPRIRSPYVGGAFDTNNRVRNGKVPLLTDTDMTKFSDTDIRTILNNGLKQTRAQGFHTSVEFGSVFADGSLTNRGTQYNEFEFPNNGSSTSASAGQRFRRRWGNETNFTGFITSGSTSGCSSAVGGGSNYYEQSCVQSGFAGCEGGPAINHRCAGNIQDRANKLIIWAA